MNCPNCKTPLTMSERQGIEIDYCPACRGVWLDRGELDKIIERSSMQATPESAQPLPQHTQPQQPHWGSHDFHQGKHHHPYRKRRKSFLEELFD
ncbi:MAG TPA: zf-TFIIB domain-containing protein [Sphingomicrobium sp.]|nr:zf-TFIIB domain-containing protein [Sphingomicrobium sp.]